MAPDAEIDAPEAHDVAPPRTGRAFSWAALLASSLTGLAALALALWVEGLVRDLLARSGWLGYAAAALAALAGLAFVVLVGRELAALLRLRAVARLRDRFARAHDANDSPSARAAVRDLVSMFADRPDTAHGRSELALHGGEVLDGADMVELAERELLAPLDRTATGLAVDSARRVSLVTAISPRAVVDVAFVAFETLRLVRRIAALYGGRPGTIGLLRLLGRIATHLAATGAIAAGDALLQQIVGHGLAARLSAKLGEGLLNGLLTARVGIAAIEVCRPMPFVASKRPGLSDFVAALAPTMTAGRKQDRPATLDRSDRDAR
jgi:putative membrane protein